MRGTTACGFFRIIHHFSSLIPPKAVHYIVDGIVAHAAYAWQTVRFIPRYCARFHMASGDMNMKNRIWPPLRMRRPLSLAKTRRAMLIAIDLWSRHGSRVYSLRDWQNKVMRRVIWARIGRRNMAVATIRPFKTQRRVMAQMRTPIMLNAIGLNWTVRSCLTVARKKKNRNILRAFCR